MTYQELWASADAFYQGSSGLFKSPISGHNYRMRYVVPEHSAWRRVIHRGVAPLMWAWLERGHRPPVELLIRVKDRAIATLLLKYMPRADMNEHYYSLLNIMRDHTVPASYYCQETEWFVWLAEQAVEGNLNWMNEHVETREQLLKQQPRLWRYFHYDDKTFFMTLLNNKSHEERQWWLEHHHTFLPIHVFREWIHICQDDILHLSEQAAQAVMLCTDHNNIENALMVDLWDRYGSLDEKFSKVISRVLLQQKGTWKPWGSILDRSTVDMLANKLCLVRKNSDLADKMWMVLEEKTGLQNLKTRYKQSVEMSRLLGERSILLVSFIHNQQEVSQSELSIFL